jgi:hypothetical protein
MIQILRDGEVPMAHWETHCECCGPMRDMPDKLVFVSKGDVLDPNDLYNEIDLVAHKDTFKFGVDYTIIEYP